MFFEKASLNVSIGQHLIVDTKVFVASTSSDPKYVEKNLRREISRKLDNDLNMWNVDVACFVVSSQSDPYDNRWIFEVHVIAHGNRNRSEQLSINTTFKPCIHHCEMCDVEMSENHDPDTCLIESVVCVPCDRLSYCLICKKEQPQNHVHRE